MRFRWALLIVLFPATVGAQVRFINPTVDLGVIRAGQALEHRFDLVNEGRDPAEIVDVRAGCGCLAPRVSRTTLQPGERGQVLIEVNSLGQAAGSHVWKATVRTRQAHQFEQCELSVRAEVVTEVTVQPASVILFIEGARTQEIVLTDSRPRPLRITAVQLTRPGLRARVVEGTPQLSRYRILLEAAADLPDGRHEDTLSIFTDDPLYRHLRVPVKITKERRSRIAFGPKQVSFTPRPGQVSAARFIRLWANDNARVDIAGIRADHAALVCTWAPGPGNHATVKVQLDARAGQLPEQCAVYVEVRHSSSETITIPVTIERE